MLNLTYNVKNCFLFKSFSNVRINGVTKNAKLVIFDCCELTCRTF